MSVTRKRAILTGVVLLAVGGASLLAFWAYRKLRSGEVVIQALETMADLKPSKREVAPVYAEQPALLDLRPEQLDEALRICQRSLFFLGFHREDRVDVDRDAFILPNAPLCEVSAEWTKVIGEDGRNLLRKPTPEEQKEFDRWPGSTTLRLSAASGVRPVTAQGSARVTVPVRFARLSLAAEEKGRVVQGQGMSGVLLECDNDFFRLRLSGLDPKAGPAIVARDADGRALEMAGWTAKPDGDGWLTARKARGRVARVEVAVPLETLTRTVPVEATAAPDGEQPAAAPRYLPPMEPPRFAALGAAEVREQTKVLARRSFAVFGYNTPKVAVALPRVDNSAYAEVRFKDVALLDRKGRPVEFERESGGLDHQDMSSEVRFKPKQGDALVEFARATGTASVRYPLRIEILKLTPKAPAARGVRMQIRGSQVRVQGLESWVGFPPDRLDRHQAFDAAGRRLRRLPYSGSSTTPEGTWQLVGFWGQPAEVRVIRVAEWTEFELPYDLRPAEKLPMSKIGQRPEAP
jgi:hypothetical protein